MLNNEYHAIPIPKTMVEKEGTVSLRNASVATKDEQLKSLVYVFEQELRTLLDAETARDNNSLAVVDLRIDSAMRDSQYTISIDASVEVAGGSYTAVANGTSLLLQLMTDSGDLPYSYIEDEPDLKYRGLLLDIGRQWHSVDSIKQVIELARFYRLSHVQLHLTDDQLFTFPLASFPHVPTPGKHYSREQMEEIVEFAHQRGVQLIPEIDLPGHSKRLNHAEPAIFTSARGEAHGKAICLGNEAVHGAVEKIIDELCDMFKYSRYVHIGCDEAQMDKFDNCPICREKMQQFEPANAESLLRNFIIRLAEIVKRNGKQPIVWEGFTADAGIEIPKDIIVVAWESYYHLPDQLSAAGYTIINASWQPLYATPTLGWSPEHIYGWNVRLWEHWWDNSPAKLNPIQLDDSAAVMGAQFCSWENAEKDQFEILHLRIPAMVERSWNVERRMEWQDFSRMLEALDRRAMKLLKIETQAISSE